MREMSDEDYIFLQNCARAHTAKVTLECLDKHCSCYITPNFWPPNSIDLNNFDFSVLSYSETRV